MMKDKITRLIFGFSFLLLICFISCEAPDQPVYGPDNPDPNPTGGTAASITAINPSELLMKEEVTISGSGFNAIPEYNMVAFGNKTGTIISASETELVVKTPIIIGDTVAAKVAIKGSEFWSNEVDVIFKPLIPEVIDDEISWPNGVAVDSDNNVYIGSANDGIIYKVTPEGTKTEFATDIWVSGAIEFGPNEYLYVCQQNDGKIVRISPDGGTVEDVVEVESVIDFDWDADGNMYIVSNWSGIFKLDGAGGLTQVAEIDNPKNIRVYENSLYISDIWNGTILRYDITASGLENEEVVIESSSPLGVEIDSNGNLYYTLAWETSLYILNADGSEDVMYEEELKTPMRYLTFYGKYIYIVYPGWGDVGVVLRVYVGEDQAPNYGRNP